MPRWFIDALEIVTSPYAALNAGDGLVVGLMVSAAALGVLVAALLRGTGARPLTLAVGETRPEVHDDPHAAIDAPRPDVALRTGAR